MQALIRQRLLLSNCTRIVIIFLKCVRVTLITEFCFTLVHCRMGV